MELWHGSPIIVKRPRIELCKPFNDYGPGFYCTPHAELAKEWACPRRDADGFANHYLLDTSDLRVLDLEDPSYTVLDWLAVLITHRPVQASSPIAREGAEYLRRVFAMDLDAYDVVRGYRADDSYFSFVRAFLNNTLSVAQLARAMHLGGLGTQVMVRSERAFDRLEFMGYERADSATFHPARAERDERARKAFATENSAFDRSGLYLRDILIEEVRPDDRRLS